MNPRIYKALGIDWPGWPPAEDSKIADVPVVHSDAVSRARSTPQARLPVAVAAPIDPVRVQAIAGLSREALKSSIEACQACELHRARQQVVPGVGPETAAWMFVGEAPGAEEDQRGEPFVGAAGQLLDRMIEALGLERSAVFIANGLKCRPPGNRTPTPEESAACFPYLARQIELVSPKVIVALGRVAAHALLKTEFNLGSLRGRVHDYQGIPLVVTYHPAYLLRNLPEKARAWQDLCLARSRVS